MDNLTPRQNYERAQRYRDEAFTERPYFGSPGAPNWRSNGAALRASRAPKSGLK